MIVCKNCGAEFDEKELKCPYCECENAAAMQRLYHREIDKVIMEREQLKKIPDKVVSKTTKKLLIAVIFLITLIVFLVLGIVYYRQFGPESRYQTEKNNKAVMEQYLDNSDYVGLCDFYSDLEYSKSIYEKYAEIERIYGYYEELQWRIEQIKYYFPYAKEDEQLNEMAKAMQVLSKLYNMYDDCMNDTRRLANEEHIRTIWEMGKTDFMREYYADEEMVSMILEIPYGDIAAYNELAGKAVNNLLEKLK